MSQPPPYPNGRAHVALTLPGAVCRQCGHLLRRDVRWVTKRQYKGRVKMIVASCDDCDRLNTMRSMRGQK